MPRLLRHCLCLALAGLLLAGCQSAPPRPGDEVSSAATQVPPPLPVSTSAHYRIDSADSQIRILVYRAGPLASLGHNHVIRAGEISGDIYLAEPFSNSAFALRLPLRELEVDPAALRAEEGADFASKPSEQAKAGTREHMLGPDCLDVEHYPELRIRSTQIIGPEWQPDITLQISLHGQTRELTVPVAVVREGDRLIAIGQFSLRQSEFGITPYSALGGGLRVQDKLRLRFKIVGQRQ